MTDNTSDNKVTLEDLRKQIDALDMSIHTMLNQRAQLAKQVAEVKLRSMLNADGSDVRFYRPEREAQVLRQVKERNQGPLSDNAVAHIFREIMSACLALEKPLTVAYLGPEGTFTHSAAIKHFGHAVIAKPVDSIDQVFAQVQSGDVVYGIVPVENSTEGMVNHTLDNFMQSDLKICGEVELPINLHLLVSPKAVPEGIKKICAHQQALAQSRIWLDNHWPNVEREAVSSNAKAARMAAEDPTIAAVAGEMAIDLYGLSRLSENIQDLSKNTTRFLIIGKENIAPSGDDKTSIIISTRNKPGALYKLLEPFHREQVMLTRIDTRPSRTENWAYVFFMEFEGHQEDEKIKKILTELEDNAVMLKPLGSYPKAAL
jgi:chorismate mutase / prephenate dehydratase